MDMTQYLVDPAVAYYLGRARRTGQPDLGGTVPPDAMGHELAPAQKEAVLEAGRAGEDKLYYFKRSHADMPRVKKVLGFLRSVPFERLLDVGSGRGVFLFPALEAFPWAQFVSLDVLPHRVQAINDVAAGGYPGLAAYKLDVCDQPFPEDSFDVVTMLEVLEHIPAVDRAVAAAVKMARNYVVVSVPNKPDDNPEHIHLLTKEVLTELFARAGCTRLHFDAVNGHLILVATVSGKHEGGKGHD